MTRTHDGIPRSTPRSGRVLGPVLVGVALTAAACSSDGATSGLADAANAATADAEAAERNVSPTSDAPSTEPVTTEPSAAEPGTDDPASSTGTPPPVEADPPGEEVADDPSTTCLDTLPDIEMECGRLAVPVDYDDPSGDEYSLPYVVLPALGDDPADEPIVFLQGGPGFSTLAIMPFFAELTEFRNDHDMVFLEQRGTDPSGVFLRCAPDLETFDDIQACRDGWVADGIDLSSFTTLNAARDLATLRSVLGIEQWHLLGGSYGTTLAMVSMDHDHDGTASVVLDAPTAPDVVIYNADIESALNAASKIFANCAADEDCNRRNPDLFDTNVANFDRLAIEPWNVTSPELAAIFGPTIDALVYLEMNTALVSGQPGALPAFVTAIAERDDDTLLQLVVSGEDADDPEAADGDAAAADESGDDESGAGPGEFAIGLNYSIYCAEEAPFFDLDGPVETVDEWPAETVESFLPPFRETCEIWDVDPADPADVDQIQSAIPTLILAGEYDHTTPLRQGEIAAAGLSEVELIEVPSTGHTTLDNACARSIMADFFGAQTGDRSCLDAIEPIVWQ